MKSLGIIPARFASSRFPGKPLVDIAGQSMIERVYRRAEQARSLTELVVATDDERIFEHVRSFGGNVLMTRSDHESGTDRCAEVASRYERVDHVVNIQGDEPFLDPAHIDLVVELLADFQIATLAMPIEDHTELFNPNVVKVVVDNMGKALYFSRSPIPSVRKHEPPDWPVVHTFLRHIGLYAFRTKTLERISDMEEGRLERAEKLEQLRWMENGIDIGLKTVEGSAPGIDTPADLERALTWLSARDMREKDKTK